MDHWQLLLGAGTLVGGMNALAGGGSFVTLATLIATGVPSVNANASSTIALYPAELASAWVYRHGIGWVCGGPLRPTLIATLVSGLIGAILLLRTPSRVFDRVLSWLLLLATAAIAAGPRLGPILRARLPAVLVIQVLLGIYGGYFGDAVGHRSLQGPGEFGCSERSWSGPRRPVRWDWPRPRRSSSRCASWVERPAPSSSSSPPRSCSTGSRR